MKPAVREMVMWAVMGARWWLADRQLRCGPAAIARHLRLTYPALSLPSLRIIARIIAENEGPAVRVRNCVR
jgi:hypothetical protein